MWRRLNNAGGKRLMNIQNKRKLSKKIIARLNDFPIQRKLFLLHIFCVLLPLLATDALILQMLTNYQRESDQRDAASAAAYYINTTVEDAARIASSAYLSRSINDFLNTEFKSTLDYYNWYQQLNLNALSSVYRCRVVMYADNDTIINGGYFRRLDRTSKWYELLEQTKESIALIAYYDDSRELIASNQRQFSLVRKLNFYWQNPTEKIVKVDMDYSSVSRSLQAISRGTDLYVCMDDKLLFTNVSGENTTEPFPDIPEKLSHSHTVVQQLSLYGAKLSIYVTSRGIDLALFFEKNWPILLLLATLNLLAPTVAIYYLSRSFAERLRALSDTVRNTDSGYLPGVECIEGQDEIGDLMRTYNDMAKRISNLIETVYKSRLRTQEVDLARQQAELLALRSQIDPHFLFNALESVRMHSLLKNETETADMVGLLALIERQYVDWDSDEITVEEELHYVEAYLQLQRYRFGEKICYQIEQQEDCRKTLIPKLTLLTFVENACRHGISQKESRGWVFVRVYRQGTTVLFEVEDTGVGLSEADAQRMQDEMNGASIDMLKGRKHIGIINACLRMKLASQEKVSFTVESEEQVGLTVTIRLEQGPNREKEAEEDAESIADRR